MKVLVDAGLVTREKRGLWVWYRLVPSRPRRTQISPRLAPNCREPALRAAAHHRPDRALSRQRDDRGCVVHRIQFGRGDRSPRRCRQHHAAERGGDWDHGRSQWNRVGGRDFVDLIGRLNHGQRVRRPRPRRVPDRGGRPLPRSPHDKHHWSGMPIDRDRFNSPGTGSFPAVSPVEHSAVSGHGRHVPRLRRARDRLRRHRYEPAVRVPRVVRARRPGGQPANAYGVASLVFWALILVISVKYLLS